MHPLKEWIKKVLPRLLLVALIFSTPGIFSPKIAQGATMIWDGGGATENWSDCDNWSTDVCPGVSDIAQFDATSAKNATIDEDISVSGINIASTYAGEITQGVGWTVTVGSGHFTQAGGTFTGGDAKMTFTNSFTLSGGTFTSTSDELEVRGNFTRSNDADFFHASGALLIAGSHSTWNFNGSLAFHDVTIQQAHSSHVTISSGNTMIVEGDLILNDGAVQTGSINVYGDVTQASNFDGGGATINFVSPDPQTYTINGGVTPHIRLDSAEDADDEIILNANATINNLITTSDFVGDIPFTNTGDHTPSFANWTQGAGTYDASAQTEWRFGTFTRTGGTFIAPSLVTAYGWATWNLGGGQEFNNFTIASGNPGYKTTIQGGQTMVVSGDLLLTSGAVDGGNIEVHGDITQASGFNGGNSVIDFTSLDPQTYTINGGIVPHIRLDSAEDADDEIILNANATITNFITTSDFVGDIPFTNTGDYTPSFTVWTQGGGAYDASAQTEWRIHTLTKTGGTFIAPELVTTYGGHSTWNFSGASQEFNNVAIEKNNFTGLDIATGSTVLLSGDLALTSGYFGGLIEVFGNITQASSFQNGAGIIDFASSDPQTYTIAGGGTPHIRLDSVEDADDEIIINGDTTFNNLIITSDFVGDIPVTNTEDHTLTFNAWTQEAGVYDASAQTEWRIHTLTKTGGTFIAPELVTTYGSGSQFTFDTDVQEFNNFTVQKNTNNNLIIPADKTIVINGLLDLKVGRIMTGTVEAYGDVSVDSSFNGGDAIIDFASPDPQTYTINGGATPHIRLDSAEDADDEIILNANATINNLITTSDFVGDIPFTNTGDYIPSFTIWTQGAGTYDASAQTEWRVHTITKTGGTFVAPNLVTTYGSGSQFTFDTDVLEFTNFAVQKNVNNNLIVPADKVISINGLLDLQVGRIMTGTVEAYGDVSVDSSFNGGDALLRFLGEAEQTLDLTNATSNLDSSIVIDKNDGLVTLASPLIMNANNQDLSIQKGRFDLNGYDLTINGSNAKFIIGAQGILELFGTETLTLHDNQPGHYPGSTVRYTGNGDGLADEYSISTVGDVYYNLHINSVDGDLDTFILENDLTINGDFSVNSGTVSADDYSIYLNKDWYNSGDFSAGTGTVWFVGNNQSIFGETVFNNLTKTIPTSLSDDLVAYWMMDEEAGDEVFDSSGNENHASAVNTAIVEGYLGHARRMEASGQYISVPAITPATSYTISLWAEFPLPVTGEWRTLVSRAGGVNHHIIVSADGNLGVYNGGFHSTGFNVNTLSEGWHNITVIAEGTGMDFYVNGLYVGSVNSKVTAEISIIGNFSAIGNQFSGSIDEVRIYSRALTEREILLLVEEYPAIGDPAIAFPAGQTTTILNTLTLNGSFNTFLSVASTEPGTQAMIDPQGTRSIEYVDVQDNNNINESMITCDNACVSSGNNTNWQLPGFIVSEISGPTSENGDTATFTVVLTTEPTETVYIPLESADTSEGTATPATLVFTTENWDTEQTVTVTGVDDDVVDGDQEYVIELGPTSSDDTSYHALSVSDVTVTNTDNDFADINVSAISGPTSENGDTATFTVTLNSEPTDDVVIAVSSSDVGEGTVDPESLTFTPENWNEPQTVTVTGVDDEEIDEDQQYTVILAPAVSDDPNYHDMDADDVTVINLDNDGFGIEVSAISGNTTEPGGTATFTVVLLTEPTADVTIPIASTDTTEGTVSTASLIFTSENWSVPQTVTVTGVNDFIDDGNIIYTITVGPASSDDDDYHNLNPDDVTVTNIDDDTANVVVSGISGDTNEGGATATFTVRLASEPLDDVMIAVSSSNTDEGTVDPETLTFTSENWSINQTVTVTGVDDVIVDGDQEYTIILAEAVSDDPTYNGMDPDDVTVTNVDDDTPGFVVSAISGNTTEAGATATFTVRLSSQPAEDVTISVESNDTSEGTVDVVSLTFTPENWDENQTVTVTGVDDDFDDGNIEYSIVLGAAVSGDELFNGIEPDNVSVTNIDNDTSGFIVSGISGATTEDGDSATFTVRLRSEPFANVTIAVSSDDETEGTADPDTLTFTSENWNMNQVVTVTGVDDDVADGDVLYTIILAEAMSDDPIYDGLNPADVTVTNLDNDEASVEVSAISGDTTEEGGTAMFTVVLLSEPASDVEIPIISEDETEGSVAPAVLTFTSENWNEPQTVTVTGVDDDVMDGDKAFTVTVGPSTSEDAGYDGVASQGVVVTNIDNDVAGITVSEISENTTEAGGTATFTVVLDSEPTTNVTIPVSSNDQTEGVLEVESLIFTPLNWSEPQTVTVTGVDDHVDDGDIAYSVSVGPAISGDGNYADMDPDNVSITNEDDDTAGFDVSEISGDTTENGGTATFTVTLTSEPTANVFVVVVSSDESEGTVEPTTLTFMIADWDEPQTVTVTGVDDDVVDGDVAYTVILTSAVSADTTYNNMNPPDVDVVNRDNDVAGLDVSAISDDTTEAGGTATFTVFLNTQPTADVVVPIQSTNTNEGTVSTEELIFTPDNWNELQIVTVTGVDDDIDDGDVTFEVIVGGPTSADLEYNDLEAQNVTVVNVDDDTAGVDVSAISGDTSEAGGTATFSVVLTSEPLSNVMISIESDNTDEGIVSTETLVFTSENWNEPQIVTVTGVDDEEVDGDTDYHILLGPVTSADPGYDGMLLADVVVTNVDDDEAPTSGGGGGGGGSVPPDPSPEPDPAPDQGEDPDPEPDEDGGEDPMQEPGEGEDEDPDPVPDEEENEGDDPLQDDDQDEDSVEDPADESTEGSDSPDDEPIGSSPGGDDQGSGGTNEDSVSTHASGSLFYTPPPPTESKLSPRSILVPRSVQASPENPNTDPVQPTKKPKDTAITRVNTQVVQVTLNATRQVQRVTEQVRTSPEAKTVASVSRPATAVTTTLSAVILARVFNLLPFLRYLFSSPVLFVGRRRRRNFGTIYNAYTKVPVDLATVRLYDQNGKLVKTTVTDREGRYFFKVDEGTYTINVQKKGYSFPSDYLKGQRSDNGYLDIYTGQEVAVSDREVIISANIPIDPENTEQIYSPTTVKLKHVLHKAQHGIAILGVILSLVVVFVDPSVATFFLAMLQVLVYLIVRYLIRPKKKKGWGIVYEDETQEPLANTVVRLFEPRFTRLIESTVTDRKGRYTFLAGPSQYVVTFEKEGYKKKEVRPVDLSSKKEPVLLAMDVSMKPINQS